MKQQTISIKGAREHNLKNISLELPREQLIVVTGLSGSGKSSLAFDTIYAEGQRRFLESLDAYTKRFTAQLKKPDVDVIYGLSPIISIEQKTVNRNPRSTIGTLTDIYDFLRLLYATAGQGSCPYCARPVPARAPGQMLEKLLSLADGTSVEICVPFQRIYGEDDAFLFGEIRSKGCRKVYIDDVAFDLSEGVDFQERSGNRIEGVIDKMIVGRGARSMERLFHESVENASRVGEHLLRFRILDAAERGIDLHRFHEDFACPEHGFVLSELHPAYFSFNDPDSFCTTCLGLGVYKTVHPDYLVPDRSRSIMGGAFLPGAFKFDKNKWVCRLIYSLSIKHGFSLDTPFDELPPEIVEILFHGTKGERFKMVVPPGATQNLNHNGWDVRFDGIITDIERRYRNYRKGGVADGWMEEYLSRVMYEIDCPDCKGRRLKSQRFLVTVGGETIHDMGQRPMEDLYSFLVALPPQLPPDSPGQQIHPEIINRIGLLLDIGLDYLNLNRKAATLSGGESQRIRLSTQISSGLMGMMYVLDEPSIGLHPKDNIKLIGTLKRLRDVGNTVIVVEHDEETIRSADHLVEMGPGPGIHGGEVVAQGTVEEVLSDPTSLTGRYLSGRSRIELPACRRPLTGRSVTVRGARQNNLRNIDVEFPIGVLTCVTGASGSGKSTLVNDILHKGLVNILRDSRVRHGAHTCITGTDQIRDVISIDQSPLGRSSRSNPATYIGVYDEIRTLFAHTDEARERGYTPTRFSFNVRGGRCEQCNGEGRLTTRLHFMPDVESVCAACGGARYNAETLEVRYKGKSIADVLDLSFEEAATFFCDRSGISHKLAVLNDLGLGYLTLGQSATTLSGGEAQRVKLGYELGKIKRGGRTFYILDEPTTGLHLADIQRFLDSINRLVSAGNTVVVIEHHLDVIKTADHVIDLGPEGGRNGGMVVASGTPEEIAVCPLSYTGHYLRPFLARVEELQIERESVRNAVTSGRHAHSPG